MSPENYSWVDEYLAGSAQPDHIDDITTFIEDDMTDLISLTPSKPLVTKYMKKEIKHHHLPISALPSDYQLKAFLDVMKQVRQENKKAVVHCQFGQERTGIMLVIYLVELVGMDVDDAIAKVRKTRPKSLRTSTSQQFLKDRYRSL